MIASLVASLDLDQDHDLVVSRLGALIEITLRVFPCLDCRSSILGLIDTIVEVILKRSLHDNFRSIEDHLGGGVTICPAQIAVLCTPVIIHHPQDYRIQFFSTLSRVAVTFLVDGSKFVVEISFCSGGAEYTVLSRSRRILEATLQVDVLDVLDWRVMWNTPDFYEPVSDTIKNISRIADLLESVEFPAL